MYVHSRAYLGSIETGVLKMSCVKMSRVNWAKSSKPILQVKQGRVPNGNEYLLLSNQIVSKPFRCRAAMIMFTS